MHVTEGVEFNITNATTEFNQQVENFETKGSGYTLSSITDLTIIILRYDPFVGSSYIATPKHLLKKLCIVNVVNRFDHKCFAYSILSALHPAKHHLNRVQNYLPFLNTINLSSMRFPTPLSDIPIFERNNPEISINVYSQGDRHTEFVVLYRSNSTACC